MKGERPSVFVRRGKKQESKLSFTHPNGVVVLWFEGFFSTGGRNPPENAWPKREQIKSGEL